MIKKFLLILIFLFGIAFVYLYVTKNKFLNLGQPVASPTLVNQVKINNTVFQVNLADTDNTRAQGLSGKSRLCETCGMLFIFNEKSQYAFWMKDMLFPLDFVWIDDNKIVDITENVPIPITATHLPKKQPKQPVNRVLEINSGTVAKYHIKIGDSVEYMFP